MYDSVATRVHKLLVKDNDVDLSFTTDIWSSDVSPTSMLSLTAQWVDADFKLQKLSAFSKNPRLLEYLKNVNIQ